MRVAIFSDVHGNLTALEAVLDHIKQQAPDLIFFAGDLCLFGARPSDCLNRIRQEDIPAIYGNTDQEISDQPLLSDDIRAEEQERRQEVDNIIEWTGAQLNVMERDWLRDLPFQRRVSPTPQPRDDLFIVHANPRDVNQPIYPSETMQKTLYGEIKQRDEELYDLLYDLVTGVLAFGHLHVPNVRQWQNITLANISSVSLPLDGDIRAKYGLLTWDGKAWSVEHHYVEYDVEKEVKLLKTLRPPGWESLCHRLQTARP